MKWGTVLLRFGAPGHAPEEAASDVQDDRPTRSSVRKRVLALLLAPLSYTHGFPIGPSG